MSQLGNRQLWPELEWPHQWQWPEPEPEEQETPKVGSEEDMAALEKFISGIQVPVVSSWLKYARYVPGEFALDLWFDDKVFGSIGFRYMGTHPEIALSFWDAPSKGKWVWAYIIRPGWRGIRL